MDRLTGLRAYVAVASLGSYTAAAARLGMAKSMVSRHIDALEGALGVRLLNRSTRTLSRTEAGEAYYAMALDLLARWDAAEAAMGDYAAAPRGTLRVVAPLAFGVLHLGPAVSAFMAAHPQLRVELRMNDALDDIVDAGWDLALRIMRLPDSSLVARRLSQTRLVLCAAPAYLDRHGAPERLQDLAGRDCLLYANAAAGGIDEWKATDPQGAEDTVRPAWTLRADNGNLLRSCALAGSGITLLPTFLVGDDLATGRLVELLPGWSFGVLGVHAVYPHRRHLAPKVQAFVDHLAAWLPPQV